MFFACRVVAGPLPPFPNLKKKVFFEHYFIRLDTVQIFSHKHLSQEMNFIRTWLDFPTPRFFNNTTPLIPMIGWRAMTEWPSSYGVLAEQKWLRIICRIPLSTRQTCKYRNHPFRYIHGGITRLVTFNFQRPKHSRYLVTSYLYEWILEICLRSGCL